MSNLSNSLTHNQPSSLLQHHHHNHKHHPLSLNCCFLTIMADRKSLLSRFWPPSSSRRTSTTQTAAAASPPATAAASTPPPPRTPARQSTTKASSKTQTRKADRTSSASSKSASGKVPTATQKTTTTLTDSNEEPKTPSPSPSSSKRASPSRFSPQSRSPPQPSSPSYQPRRPSKSPSRLTSPSPKQESLKLPVPVTSSKGSTQPTETVSTSSEAPTLALEEKEPKPAPPQQEPAKKEDVKPDTNKVVDSLTQEETKPSQLSATPVQGPEKDESIKSLDPSSGNEASTKLDHAKPEEPKDVKEVVQATTYIEADEETKKEVDDSGASKSISEAAKTPNEAEKIQREKKQTTLETPADGTASQPIKRSKNLGEQVPLHKSIEANQMAMGDPKRAISDKPVNVITLAGENRGASMQMDSDSSKREVPIHIHRGYKINPEKSPEATSDAEENSEEKRSGDERYMENQLMEAYVNNNAQGVNNSIVLNSSIVEGNPGVHVVVTHLSKEPVQSKDKASFPETRKAEVSMSHAKKLTYQPTIRRRCLRGLLQETSDSDAESPEKPRRHGCRVGCQKGDGENNVDVL